MSDRLDRIEAILAENAKQLVETRQITESNARAIEAWSSRIEEGIAEAEEVSSSMSANTNTRMEAAITDTVQMIANLGTQLAETDKRFNNLLEEGRADRAEMRAAREQWQLEAQANTTEHRAFTQNIQILLAEIARLWQRVAS
jgi:hypothetical protein